MVLDLTAGNHAGRLQLDRDRRSADMFEARLHLAARPLQAESPSRPPGMWPIAQSAFSFYVLGSLGEPGFSVFPVPLFSIRAIRLSALPSAVAALRR